jgi:hypothetical protein
MPPRTQRTPARGATGRDAPKTRSSYRGSDGMRQMNEEQKRGDARKEAAKAKGHEPFRFWTPQGETRQIIIVDEKPDFFRYEHALKDPRSGRYDNFLPCINEDANCPVCTVSEKPAYFGMYLTVIDLTPYDDKDGNEVPWSKKIMVVKPAQQKKIARLYEKHGSLYGMVVDMTRDGAKDASIGNDIEFVEFADDKEMESFYRTYKDKENKTVEIIGNEPFDYDKIYPEMTEKQLCVLAGVEDTGSVGKRGSDDKEIGRTRGRAATRRDDDEDDAPPTRGRRRAVEEEEEEPAPRRGRGRAAAEEEEDEPAPRRGRGRAAAQEEEEEEPAPRRGRRAAAEEEEEEPAPRRGRRAAAEEEEDEPAPRRGRSRVAAEEEEEEPAPRRGRGRAAPEPEEEEEPAPRRGRGRAAAEEEDEPAPRRGRGRADAADAEPPFDDEEETKPAARRQALRGRRS